ncbi:hypothetical protein [Streptacidiphilus anmyonensis]|uniref:hypothetical protein n=1 Tax=Streptacidiphilus anmyonensis TaxID=405782 RepID=UPI0005A82033|nr:hypothetical protein [Streptacidiphilus anmyonensis]
MKHTSHPNQATPATGVFKWRGIKTALIGVIAAGGLIFSTGSASADGLGGDVYTPNCHAWVAPGDNGHWAYGTEIGLAGCMVRLWAKTSTGTWEHSGWSAPSTFQYYHADGVHWLYVQLGDPTGMIASGPLVY